MLQKRSLLKSKYNQTRQNEKLLANSLAFFVCARRNVSFWHFGEYSLNIIKETLRRLARWTTCATLRSFDNPQKYLDKI